MSRRHSTPTTVLRRLVVLFLLGKLGVLVSNLLLFPVLGSRRTRTAHAGATAADPPAVPPRVSLLVPVRDEEHRLAACLSDVLAQGAAEVLVLDDQSRDGTRALATALTAGHPGARVVAGVPAPAGWVGKNWACQQLAEQATGSLLVFCDADVGLAPGALGEVVAQMRAQGADVFSVFPHQVTGTLGEHLVVPLVDDTVLCLLPFGLLSVDQPAAATASGALMAFTRDAYDRLGGHGAVRAELVEDVALARLTRRSGLRLGLALGGSQVRVRMYDGYPAVVRGFARGLVPVAAGSRALLVAGLAWHLLAYTAPLGLVRRDRAWLVPLALAVGERALVELKTGRRRLWQAPLTSLSPLAVVPVVAQALRRRQTWKGRVYA